MVVANCINVEIVWMLDGMDVMFFTFLITSIR